MRASCTRAYPTRYTAGRACDSLPSAAISAGIGDVRQVARLGRPDGENRQPAGSAVMVEYMLSLSIMAGLAGGVVAIGRSK